MDIQEKRLKDTFIELVRVPCPSLQETEEAALLARKLEALGLTGGSGETRYYTSGDAAAFSAAASALLGQEIHAEHVPAMEI